ncbi:MAG: tetraacyldisaccharide 4'-kinase [Phycisphaeraceae bacterium]|nr:tetraacyldisaccharide 4'-kinase [Phycisphaeraceae bacterium]
MDRTHLLSVLRGRSHRPTDAAMRTALSCLTPAYRAAVAARNAMFDLHLRAAFSLDRPTVSVGNLTTGGTGKTPMVAALALMLREAGHLPAVLLRGYRAAKGKLADEAVLLTRLLGTDIPVEANPCRAAGAKAVLTRTPSVTVFLLDDGFQHRQAKRDVDLVLVDAVEPWGLGRLLPRGLLREPLSSLSRATGVIVTRADQVSPRIVEQIDATVRQWTGQPPTAHVAFAWSSLRDADDRELPLAELRGRRVAGVCGIGNPAGFEASLRQHADEVIRVIALPDHHDYTADEVVQFLRESREAGADVAVTTDKDFVKWSPDAVRAVEGIKVVRPAVRARFLDGLDALRAMLPEVRTAAKTPQL